MVVLREGMCPGLDADLVRDLRAADIKTGECLKMLHLKYKLQQQEQAWLLVRGGK